MGSVCGHPLLVGEGDGSSYAAAVAGHSRTDIAYGAGARRRRAHVRQALPGSTLQQFWDGLAG